MVFGEQMDGWYWKSQKLPRQPSSFEQTDRFVWATSNDLRGVYVYVIE
jgi:hypothetical protein